MTMFGAAYLGYVGGLFDEGFEAGFPAWLWETNEAMLLEYPFIAEIDEEHMIGGAGHLYCIVPVDENATVAINTDRRGHGGALPVRERRTGAALCKSRRRCI